jgi:hypothetical protein
MMSTLRLQVLMPFDVHGWAVEFTDDDGLSKTVFTGNETECDLYIKQNQNQNRQKEIADEIKYKSKRKAYERQK